MEDLLPPLKDNADSWWAKRRLRYNIGLAFAGALAFVAYALLAARLVPDVEISLFTIGFQGTGYLFMMLIANLFYLLGPVVDRNFNSNNNPRFRSRLFLAGCIFSYGLPFSIPVMIIMLYG